MNVAASMPHVALKYPPRQNLWYVAILLVIVLGGCNRHPTRVPVSGTVLIDGAPLKEGNIKFVPKDGRPSSGKINDGRFSLTCFEANDGTASCSARTACKWQPINLQR